MRLSRCFLALFVAALANDDQKDAVPLERPGAQVLYLELPMRDGILHIDAPSFAITPGLSLDKSRPARVWVAYYETAHLSWLGSFGTSDPQNVPHHEFNIQLPVTYKGQSFYHCVYSLTDDDIAMLFYRDAQGAPSKLADFTFPATDAQPSTFNIARRNEVVLKVSGGLGKPIDVGSSMLSGLFDNTLNMFATQALMPSSIPFFGTNPSNSVFLLLRSSLRGIQAWEYNAESVMVPTNVHERIWKFFPGQPMKPTKALWMKADIGAAGDPVPKIVAPVSQGLMDLKYFMDTFMLRVGGAQVDPGVPKVDGNEYEWQNGRFIWISVKVKPDIAQKQLPPGAILADDTAHIFCANYPTATLNAELGSFDKSIANDNYPYHEFGIRLQAKLMDGTYHHVTYILVDDDVPLMTGRDMLGTPKKMASKIVFPKNDEFVDGNVINLYIERRGQPVINFTGRVGKDTPDKVAAGLTDDIKDFSVYANEIPSYFNGDMPAGVQGPVFVKWFGSHDIHENKALQNTSLTFGSSVFEPLSDWLVDGPAVDAGFVRMDFGKVDDLKSRPVIGKMPLGDAAVQYYHDIFQSHYGGAPMSNSLETRILV